MTIRTQILKDTKSLTVVKFMNDSGTAEAAVLKADISTFLGAALDGSERVEITDIEWMINGGSVTLFWTATADLEAISLTGVGKTVTNIKNDAGEGVDGNVALTANGGFGANSTYTIIITLRKVAGFA